MKIVYRVQKVQFSKYNFRSKESTGDYLTKRVLSDIYILYSNY